MIREASRRSVQDAEASELDRMRPLPWLLDKEPGGVKELKVDIN
jgi:hypothetical protein